MKGWGLSLVAFGLLIAIGALFMTTTAPVDVPSAYGYGVTRTSEVHNLGLLQNQKLVFDAGLALFVAGVALAAAGQIEELLQSRPAASDILDPIQEFVPEQRSTIGYEPPAAQPVGDDKTVLTMAIGIGIVVIVAILMIFAGAGAKPS